MNMFKVGVILLKENRACNIYPVIECTKFTKVRQKKNRDILVISRFEFWKFSIKIDNSYQSQWEVF